MSAAARFKQEDLTRALKGAAKGGMRVARIEIDPTGTIIILPVGSAAAKVNTCDDLLTRDA